MLILTCKLGNEIINCYDGTHDKEQLKKWASKKILLCPICGRPYEYCHGKVKTPYFRHMDKIECEYLYSEPETEEHLNGKRDLFEWIKNQDGVTDAVLEGWIPETKQRPDIMFKYDGKKYVIEYQCSPIATEYIERHDLYKAAGIIDIWILGTDKYIEKSEVGKTFRTKEIEKYINIYYDVEGKSIISNLIDISALSDECINEMCSFFLYSDFSYFIQEKRQHMFDCLISNDLITCSLQQKCIAPIKILSFYDNKFSINKEYIGNIESFYYKKYQEEALYHENLMKLANFRNKIFTYYDTQYDIKFSCMPSQSNVLGFKYAKQYFGFKNIDNYPIVDFCKINYMHDSAFYDILTTVDVSKDGFDYVRNILDELLSEEIRVKQDINDFIKKVEQQRKEEYDNLAKKLSAFRDKPIYLLFMENKNNLSSNIRFKFFNGASDDILVVMRHLYNDLRFLKKKNAERYVFMIPRKKWRTSSTGLSRYKVRNHPTEVISDFKTLGFTVLTYNDLISEVQHDK